MTLFKYPYHRPRRLRQNASIRSLVSEYQITANDLIMPFFILEGDNQRQEIPSMQHVFRLSIDLVLKELSTLIPLGLKAIALFPIIDNSQKNELGSTSYNPDNLMCRAISEIKNKFPELLIIADVALDPYTSHGHDGILDEYGYMLNDKTVDILVKQALCQAHAGADIIAPSDMCDGRIGAIRQQLEQENKTNTIIMAYSAKYASHLYGPFRDAVGSNGALKGDKKTYQMDYHNRQEAINEVALDIQEGADIVMIKPTMMYLDIIRQTADQFTHPICAYQVSGEYAMINYAVQQNPEHAKNIITESLVSIKRAGSNMIISYFSEFMLKNILT